ARRASVSAGPWRARRRAPPCGCCGGRTCVVATARTRSLARAEAGSLVLCALLLLACEDTESRSSSSEDDAARASAARGMGRDVPGARVVAAPDGALAFEPPTPSPPTPSAPTPSLPTPSLPTPSLPTPSLPTPSPPSAPAPCPDDMVWVH